MQRQNDSMTRKTGKGKIAGILSMQRVINYGSFLQAYALSQLMYEAGAEDVYFIDIRPGRDLNGYVWKNDFFHRSVRLMKSVLAGTFLKRMKDRSYMLKVQENIEGNFGVLGLDRPSPDSLDLAVIGSDEVFNCCQASGYGYSLQLYGDIPEARRVISYAGSFGQTTLSQLREFSIDKEIGDTMKKMAAISVRDANSSEIVTRLTGIVPEIHLDPVLIYGYGKEIREMPLPAIGRYMIVYTYSGRIKDREEVAAIRGFAKAGNLKLISIYCRYDWCDEAIVPDTPVAVLSWFKGAEYIVTDTFHGTIFSIVTKSTFCCLVRDSNRFKLMSLLDGLHLADRAASADSIREVLNKEIDYGDTYDILDRERKKAMAYLEKYMSCTGNELI